MADLDKAIKGFSCCKSRLFSKECFECPYEKDCYHDGIPTLLIFDALELLKEQQPKKVVYDINGFTGLPVSFCPSCGEGVNMYAYGRNDLPQVFCPYCGQALDWKDGEQE